MPIGDDPDVPVRPISGSQPDQGHVVSGALPGVLVLLQPADSEHVVIASSPSPSNGFQRLTLRPAPAGAAQGYNEVFDRASQEYKNGNATAAYQDCASLITADGSRWEAYYLAGLSLIALQQPAQAASLFQYALQYAPESARGSITQQPNMAQAAQNSQQAQQPPTRSSDQAIVGWRLPFVSQSWV